MLMVEGRGTIRAGGALSAHVQNKQEEEGPVHWKVPGCGGRVTEGWEFHVRENSQRILGLCGRGGSRELRGYEILLQGQEKLIGELRPRGGGNDGDKDNPTPAIGPRPHGTDSHQGGDDSLGGGNAPEEDEEGGDTGAK